jgi:protein SCO1/2
MFKSLTAAGLLVVSIVIFTMSQKSAASNRWGPDYFPNVPLITQDGKTVHFYDDLLKNKIVAIDLIYTTCKYECPLETARLAQAQKILGDRVGKDIFFYSITIDPEHDTPAVLKAYAEKFHAGPGWLFLTGREKDIELISKKIGLYTDPKESRDHHTTILMVGDVANGQWMRNSATDNPRFLATMISGYLNSWKTHKAQPGATYADAQRLPMSAGQYLFARRCAACHTVGGGDSVGPDLAGVTISRPHDWLFHFIKRPEQMLDARDPVATALMAKYKNVRMPNLTLGDGDVDALIGYLKEQTARLHSADVAASRAPKEGQTQK